MTKLIKLKLKIEGMHCSSCSILIDSNLEELEGVTYANTSYTKSESEIEFDEEKVEIEKILQIVEQAGYKATAVKS